jgi:hypothetical protein
MALADLDLQAGDVSIFLNARRPRQLPICAWRGTVDSTATGAFWGLESGSTCPPGPDRPEQTEGIKPRR